MKCCSRPTRFRDRRVGQATVVVLALLAGGIGSAAQAADGNDGRLREAMASAVQARLGGAAEVEITALASAIANDREGEFVATPDPTGRTGSAIRFALAQRDAATGTLVRVGQASAMVTVSAEHVRTRRSVPRGTVLAADDLEAVRGRLPGMPLHHLLSIAEAVGARAPHDLAAGTVLTASDLVVVPAVRSGDRVRAVVHVGSVEASMMAVAVEGGPLGRIIRIVNTDSHRTLRGRITGSGEVEVMNER